MHHMSKPHSTNHAQPSRMRDGEFAANEKTQLTGSHDLPDLLSYDLARITGESVMTHRRRKMLGTGPRALRIGRHIRFHPRDVSEWLERCAQSGKGVGLA